MTTEASNPKPHVNGAEKPAVCKQEQVPVKMGQRTRGTAMPEPGATLPKSILM